MNTLHKEKIQGFLQILEILDAATDQFHLLLAFEEIDTCPAAKEYGPAFEDFMQILQKEIENISAFCEQVLPRIKKGMEEYNMVKLQAMANCTSPTCEDKEYSRRILGWTKDQPPLSQ